MKRPWQDYTIMIFILVCLWLVLPELARSDELNPIMQSTEITKEQERELLRAYEKNKFLQYLFKAGIVHYKITHGKIKIIKITWR